MNETKDEIMNLRGTDFEDFCKELLIEDGFRRVERTKGSGDQGADLIAIKDGKKYAFQCKGHEKPIGNHAVMEAHAGKDFYKADIAVVLINNIFTPSAKKLAENTNVQLWDLNDILEIMRSHKSFQFNGTLEEFLEKYKPENLPAINYITSEGVEIPLNKFVTTDVHVAEVLDRLFYGKAAEIMRQTDRNVFYCIKRMDIEPIYRFEAYYTLIGVPDSEIDNIRKQFGTDYYMGIVYRGWR